MFVQLHGRDLSLLVHDPGATDADLARVAGLPRPARPRRLVDLGLVAGRSVGGCSPGAVEAAVEVVRTGGLAAGVRVPVPAATVAAIGRGAGSGVLVDDPAVSRVHASLAVDAEAAVALADAGSRNGTWLLRDGVPVAVDVPVPLGPGDEVRVGRSRLAVGTVPPDGGPVGGGRRPDPTTGTTPHNRPPRPARPAAPGAVAVPHPPAPPGRRIPLGVASVVGPLVLAGAMVWFLGNPAFALFALLSPVLAVAGHVEARRRDRRGSRRDAAAWAAALATFAEHLAVAARMERARRCASSPDPAEVLRRATRPATSLWERRPGHDDWLRLRVGTGVLRWAPPLRDEPHGPRPAEVAAAIEAVAELPGVPVEVDLAGGGVVGVVGPPEAARAVARSLLAQAVVHHGPSDLEVLMACGADAVAPWAWTKWLPHVDDPAGGPRRLAPDRATADLLADARLDRARIARGAGLAPPGPTLLVVVDGDELLEGRRAPVRALLDGRGGPAAGIVVAAAADRLPAACTAVVTVDAGGAASLGLPATGTVVELDADGLDEATATTAARALARFDDPELDVVGAGLPAVVALRDLLGLERLDGPSIARAWAGGGPDPAPTAPLGVDAAGTVTVDLATDGPHALVAGTTGAGKSELLRTLVAALAAGASPDHLTFLLVDFKGGSAFDACARLPHAVGLVTDLDADLADRALRCLEAELRHRERRLRAAGAADLAALRARPGHEPLPRLVVVVDEFATLKAEVPGFVDALVGVAQRGRSLGVHLVLATQRPAGAVSEHIKANAALRIALRVQDPADSVDVVDRPDAATLPRGRPGRACLRLGPGELLTVQTALATAPTSGGGPPVEVHPFCFGPWPTGAPVGRGAAGPASSTGPTDLDHLVDACVDAFAASGRPAPRRPWPPPLPERLALEAVLDRAADGRRGAGWRSTPVAIGLADDPDGQRQLPTSWRPEDGNLLVTGVGGSGTTTTLLAVARSLTATAPPDDLHLFVLDGGAGELGVLGGLPHVAAVVGATERERQHRLVRHLRRELDRRRSSPGGGRPGLVLLVDGVGRFLADFDDVAGLEVVDAFGRVFVDGPEVDIRVVAAVERAGALPAALAATVRQRWVHRSADAMEAAAAGVGGAAAASRCAALPPGRFVDVASGLQVQVAVPAHGWSAALAEVAAQWPAPTTPPPTISAMPTDLDLDVALAAVGGVGSAPCPSPWRLPIGVTDDEEVAVLVLHDGDHVLVAGPGRSGRTTALATIGAALRRTRPDATVVALAGRRSWLPSVPGLVTVPDLAAALAVLRPSTGSPAAGHGGARRPASVAASSPSAPSSHAGLAGPVVLLVDDAEAVEDPEGELAALLAADGVHVVAAVRNDVARGLYQHWIRTIRRSRLGVLLRPDVDLDGDLLGAVLPRRSAAPWVPGRGYLVVDGEPVLTQLARRAGGHERAGEGRVGMWEDAPP